MSDEKNTNAGQTEQETNDAAAAQLQAPEANDTNAVPEQESTNEDVNATLDPTLEQDEIAQTDAVEMQGPTRLAAAMLSVQQSAELKKEYRSLLEEQRMLRARSKQQGLGNKAGSGFMMLVNEQGQKDERVFARVRGNIFGAIAEDQTDAQRIEAIRKKEQELQAEGKTKEERQEALSKMPSRQMSDCYTGFMLNTSFFGGSALGFLIDDGSQQKQEVYDNGESVKVATHGAFNATSSLFMAKAFMENRLMEPVQDEDGNITMQKKESISVNISAKGDLKSKVGLGGVSSKEKETLMVIANLHQANRFGVQLDLSINGQQVDLQKYVEQNRDSLNSALQKTNDKLDMIGQEPIKSLDDLLEKQLNGFDIDQDIELTDPSANVPQPEAQPDQAQAQEAENPEDAALEAQLEGEDVSAGAPEPPKADTPAIESDASKIAGLLGSDKASEFKVTDIGNGRELNNPHIMSDDESIPVDNIKTFNDPDAEQTTDLNVGNKPGEMAGSNVPAVPGENVAKQIEHEQNGALPAPKTPSRDSLEGPETPKQLPPPPRSPGMGNGLR